MKIVEKNNFVILFLIKIVCLKDSLRFIKSSFNGRKLRERERERVTILKNIIKKKIL